MTSQTDYPVELEPVDIAPYKAGNTGIDYVTTFDSGRAGPHVLLSAIVHGNELCGAIALDFLFRNEVRPQIGKLTLAFANYRAYQSFDPANAKDSRFVDEDFNRVWNFSTLDGDETSQEKERARELRPAIDACDYLLDIHSMQQFNPPLNIAGLAEKSLEFAVGVPEWVVADTGHAAGRRMRDYGDFADPDSPKTAMLIECGQHWEPASAPVAIDACLRFMKRFGTIDQALLADHHLPAPERVRKIRVTEAVTMTTDEFRFTQDYHGMEIIAKAGSVIGYDGDVAVTTPYDDCVLIMPTLRRDIGGTAVRLGRIVD